jgi:Flp pilus assembly protein TadG
VIRIGSTHKNFNGQGDAMRGFRSIDRVRGDHGAQAVEFALLSIPLLTIIYGLIAFGFIMNQQITATQLAREAARSAAICAGSSGQTATSCNGVGSARFSLETPPGFDGTVSVDSSQCFATPATDATAKVSVSPILPVPLLTTIKGVSTTPCGG